MEWIQLSILLLVVSVIGVGIIHSIDKIATILDHHFHHTIGDKNKD